MKIIIILGLCIIFILFQSAYALEDSYPFLGRFVDDKGDGIEYLSVKILFDDCISKELFTDNDGEFAFVINNDSDFLYKDSLQPCARYIQNDKNFSLIIDQSVINCPVIDNYGNFVTGSSLAVVGTHEIESCIPKEDPSYKKPVSGGGGSKSKTTQPTRTIIIGENSLQDFIESTKEKPQIQEKSSVIRWLKFPSAYISQAYIISTLILLLIIVLLILVLFSRKRDEDENKDSENSEITYSYI